MTGRRFRFSYRLRFMLICVACLSLLCAMYVHFIDPARKRVAAVDSIQKLGVSAIPTNSTIEFQQFAMSGPNGESQILTLPVISVQQSSSIVEFGRAVLGDAIFSDYSAILVQKPLESNIDELNQHVSNLPNIKTVYYYGQTLDQIALDEFREAHPKLKFEKLAGTPMQVPSRSASLNDRRNTK